VIEGLNIPNKSIFALEGPSNALIQGSGTFHAKPTKSDTMGSRVSNIFHRFKVDEN
jgi:hypothetical protein